MIKRQVRFLIMLDAHEEYRPVEHYAKQLKISRRTAYSDLNFIEKELKKRALGYKIVKKRGKGIKLTSQNGNQKNLCEMLLDPVRQSDQLSVQGRRTDIAIGLLVRSNEYTTINQLAQRYYVSNSSIVNDLKQIELQLSNSNVKLQKDSKGTLIVADELDIRKALILILTSDDSLLVKITDKDQAVRVLKDLENVLECHVSDIYRHNLLCTIAVMFLRMNDGFILKKTNRNEDINQLKTYVAVRSVLVDEYGSAPDGELRFLNDYLIGIGIENEMGSSYDLIQEYTKRTGILARKMICFVESSLNVDLQVDSILYRGLVVHLGPMIYRLENNIVIKNPLMDEIKMHYPTMYGVVSMMGYELEHELGFCINEDELGFLFVHFQAAKERAIEREKIVIICSDGFGTSELIANRISRYVPQIEIKAILSEREVMNTNLKDVNFAVSSVPGLKLTIPVVYVSRLAEFEDIKRIQTYYLSSSKLAKEKRLNLVPLVRLIHTECIFLGQHFNDYIEVLTFVGEKLQELGRVKPGYTESLLKREALSSTAIGNNLAIPHGNSDLVNQSCLFIVTFKNSISWRSNENVQMICVLVWKNEIRFMDDVRQSMCSLYENKELVQRMAHCPCKKIILTLFKPTKN